MRCTPELAFLICEVPVNLRRCHTLALFMGRFTKGLFVNMGVFPNPSTQGSGSVLSP